MLKIRKFSGTEKKLYELVAPLVMNPRVLRQNRNYPFKTAKNFIWFVAVDEKEVKGFLPVEKRDLKAIINNYYVKGENMEWLQEMVEYAAGELIEDFQLVAIVQNPHKTAFEKSGFTVDLEWKNYVKMIRTA